MLANLVLVRAFLRNGGIGRAVLVACCTAMVSGLLFVALVTVLYTYATSATFGGSQAGEDLSDLIDNATLRMGYLTGVLLITLAPLTLLRQVLRMGTAAREQRLAGLRLAGATPADVRRLAGIEVGLPSFAGGLVGYLVFLGLRAVFGGVPVSARMFDPASEVAYQLRLIPMTVSPTWWQVLLVALAVGAAGAIGAGATIGRVRISPLGVSRQAPRAAPRPWVALSLLVLGVAGFCLLAMGTSGPNPMLGSIAAVLLVVVGLLLLTPWLTYVLGRLVVARAASAHVLLAGRRLVTDPRPAGRAAAALGVIGLVAGFGSVFVTILPRSAGGSGLDPFYVVPTILVGIVLFLSLPLTVFSLAVHGAETLMDRKRAIASLAAAGAVEGDLVRAQRWEVGLVAVPVTVVGLLFGAIPAELMVGVHQASSGRQALSDLVVSLATAGCAALAVFLATALTRPWLRRAASPTNLRTA